MAAGKWTPVERVLYRTYQRGDCWEFRGAQTPLGYGNLRVGGRARGKVFLTHRITYEAVNGPIPKGLTMDHLCRNPWCVKPSHLEAVTHRENVLRGMRGRLKTHCSQGHDWVPANIYTDPKGRRQCHVCMHVRNRKGA